MQSNHDQRSKLDSVPSLLGPRLGSRVHETHKLADFIPVQYNNDAYMRS